MLPRLDGATPLLSEQRSILGILTMLLVSVLVGCAEQRPTLRRFEYAEVVMGVQARIILYEGDQDRARQAARAAFDRLQHLDNVMSDYRNDSELMRLCEHAGEGPEPVSEDLFAVLAHAQGFAADTAGAFDPTVGPLIRLWRQARRESTLPDSTKIEAARDLVGWHLLHLDAQARTVALEQPGMQLDLGGIGKGFAADAAVQTLAGLGVRHCLIDLGGDLSLGDPPPGAAGWRIAAEVSASGPQAHLLELANCGVATSGDRFQFVEFEGNRYSHLIDPATGWALTDRRTVTIIAANGTTADALASAVSVLPIPAALRLLDSDSLTSGCIRLETDEGHRLVRSEGFPTRDTHGEADR